MERVRTRIREQDGWVIVTAMLVLMLMLMLGLALTSIADTESQTSGKERVSESAFNLAEGVLSTQAVVLQNNWPTKAQCATITKSCGYAEKCVYTNGAVTAHNESSGTDVAVTGATGSQCPAPSEFIGAGKAFSNSDISTANTNFTVRIRDDIGGNATSNPGYVRASVDVKTCPNSAGTANQLYCTYDANADNKLWVRVEAWTGRAGPAVGTSTRDNFKRTRRLVALLQLENTPLPFAQNTVSGGS